jgi:hypothetical protein
VCATPPGSTGCIDPAPASGQRYDYSLFAVDAAGNPSATTASALALDSVPPASPTGLLATPGDGLLSLAWTAPADPGVTGYRVVYKPGTAAPATAGDGTMACEVAPAATVSCSAGGLVNGSAVSLTVFARDEAGNWSIPGPDASATATPVAPPSPPAPPTPQIPQAPDRTPPGRPTHVRVTISATGVTLRWTNPAARDLAHLVITRNAGHRPQGPGDGRRTVLGRATEATLATARGARFHLALYAYDRAGNVSQPTAVYVTVPRVFPLPATAVAGRSPRLSWATVTKAAYYNVVITRDGARVAIGWPTGPSWTPPKLKAGLYRWYVWPGFGSKAAARYGKLIGSSSFRIR